MSIGLHINAHFNWGMYAMLDSIRKDYLLVHCHHISCHYHLGMFEITFPCLDTTKPVLFLFPCAIVWPFVCARFDVICAAINTVYGALGYQHKRAKRVHTFGSKKQVRHDPPSDAYYCNMSNSPKAMENENEIDRDNINNNNNKVYKSLRSQRSVNYVTVTDELQAAMIRNGIGGSCATVAAAFVLIAFYFASCNITHEKYNKRLWTSGFILFANMFRYLVLYVCMTVTYKDWKVMLFPWKCSVRNH
eukprot:452362_1